MIHRSQPFARGQAPRAGFTLLEMMMAIAILAIVMGALFGLWLGISDTAVVQDAKAITSDESRRALGRLVPLVRQAGRMSINWDELPGEVLRFRMATDLDGNGTAVDSGGNLELGPEVTVQRDLDDLNEDGHAGDQLVMVTTDPATGQPTATVLANDLVLVNETVDGEGVLGPEQDLNGNGRLDRGFWVEPLEAGLLITVGAERESRKGHAITTALTEFVTPRN